MYPYIVSLHFLFHNPTLSQFQYFFFLPIFSDIVIFSQDYGLVICMFFPTYPTPKSSTIKQNWIGLHLCLHRPGVVLASYDPSFSNLNMSCLFSIIPDWGSP